MVGTLGIVFSIPGQTMGFSVFTDILMRELGLTRVQLSAAYCIGTVLSGLTLPKLGTLFDQLGARRMIVYSSLATGLILVYLSQTKRLLEWATTTIPWLSKLALAFVIILIGFYLVRAAAQGVMTMTSRNAIGKWFDFHRGTALAVSGIVTSFSFSIAPRVLDFLIEQFGWSGAWLWLGVTTIVVMGGIGWLLFRDNPEECGLTMDGPGAAGKIRQAHADSIIHRDYQRSEALRTWAFWAFNLTFLFVAFNHTAFTFHIVSIGDHAGRIRSEVISFFVPMAFISVLTNMVSGWTSPRTRLKHHLMLMNAATLLGVLGTIYLGTSWGAACFVIGNGMAGGFYASLTGIVWPRFFGRQWLGAISGVSMACTVIASGIGPLAFSLSLHWTGNYAPILWLSAIVPTTLLIASGWADNPQRERS